MRALFAHGKLFVFGEWSVLFGGRAVLACAEAGLRGRLALRPCEGAPSFTFSSVDFGTVRTWKYAGAWREVGGVAASSGAIDVAGAVMTEASELLGAPGVDVSLEVVSEGLFAPDGQKYGFGSSGALSALVAKALCAGAGVADEEQTLQLAMAGHRRAQAGKGSGADVAVSVLGGTLVFSLPDPPTFSGASLGARPPTVVRARKPDGLELLSVWSGREADTRALMRQIQALAESDPARWAETLAQVRGRAEEGVCAWLEGRVDAVLESAAASSEALRAMGLAAGVSVVTRAHDDISLCVDRAAGASAVAKTSGAGGGDMAVVLARSQALDAVKEALDKEGYRWMALM